MIVTFLKVQSNLCIATTLGIQNLWPLLTSGRYSEVVVNAGLTVLILQEGNIAKENNFEAQKLMT
jgi:hypothetical protein